ncbi:DUF5694 domain-containing protein [Mucilaginibacter sp. PAMB04274]|uniref:DUF5694 domain-containing protein n=1 Tax=Mucilaginibacter sp. PAMB04274 TaxID=3138568 RepID=UPI0031F6E304
MKPLYSLLILLTGLVLPGFSQTQKPQDKISIMLMGSTHFGQEAFHKQGPSMDLFSAGRQKEIAAINNQLAAYKPDMILIEREPSEQHMVDSLYQLFKSGKLEFIQLEHGRAEQYQFGYNIARKLNLPRVYAVDFYTSVPTRLIKEGKNLEHFTDAMNAYSAIGRTLDGDLKEQKLSLKGYLLKLNSPQLYQLTYYNIYINPAKITNGSFGKTDQITDTARIDKEHIGADYISLFYSRELKIYSNILSVQQAYQGKRILLIMGQRHAAVLSKIFENDPAYQLVPISQYLK